MDKKTLMSYVAFGGGLALVVACLLVKAFNREERNCSIAPATVRMVMDLSTE